MSEKKKYRVVGKVAETWEATIEAKSLEEAWKLAEVMDSGEFEVLESESDFYISGVKECAQ